MRRFENFVNYWSKAKVQHEFNIYEPLRLIRQKQPDVWLVRAYTGRRRFEIDFDDLQCLKHMKRLMSQPEENQHRTHEQ